MPLLYSPPPTIYPEHVEDRMALFDKVSTEELLRRDREDPNWFKRNMLQQWPREYFREEADRLEKEGPIMTTRPCVERVHYSVPTHDEVRDRSRWMNPEKKMQLGNPCSEILMGSSYQTLEGETLYCGPLTEFQYDEDDGDMYLTQRKVQTNPRIFFGPLSCNLGDLIKNEGYWLDCRIQRRNRRYDRTLRHIRIYLTNGIVRYKIATTSWIDLQSVARIGGQYDLADHINIDVNLVRASSSMPIIQEVHIVDERDPFEVIQERYKKPKRASNPNVPLPGSNHTLREEVRYQLTGKTPDQL